MDASEVWGWHQPCGAIRAYRSISNERGVLRVRSTRDPCVGVAAQRRLGASRSGIALYNPMILKGGTHGGYLDLSHRSVSG